MAAFTSPTTVEFQEEGQAMYLGRFVGDGIALLSRANPSILISRSGLCEGTTGRWRERPRHAR